MARPASTLPHLPVAPTSPSPPISTEKRLSCWPNELESLLLQAGLWPLPRALDAWNQFCAQVEDIGALDDGCYRLFPLVAGNLQACEPPVPHRDRIQGVLRHAWTKNQRLLGQLAPLLRALQEAQISFLPLKGAALTEIYRRHGSVRPMADIDILIDPADVIRAVALLLAKGCTADPFPTPERLLDLIRFRHELTLKSADGADLDIHWYLLSDTRHLEAQDLFWRDAAPCALAGLTCRALHPADQLLHTCLHGAQWNEVSPVRWLADAMMLIREGVDWSRLEQQARQLERLQPVRETLLFLDQLGMSLPPGVAEHWRALKITAFEEVEGGYRTFLPNSRERTKQLAWLYLRLHRNDPLGTLLRNAPVYMRQLHHFRAYSRRLAFYRHLLVFHAGRLARD